MFDFNLIFCSCVIMALSASLLAPVQNAKDRMFRARSATPVDIAPVERPPTYKHWSEVAMVNAYIAAMNRELSIR